MNIKILRAALLSISLLLATATASATDLENIERITSLGSGDIVVEGDVNLSGNDIRGYFDSSCGVNEAVTDVYNNGSFNCGQAGGGLPSVLDIDNSANQNIDLNGYELVDNTGDITLGGGNVDITDGNLNLDLNKLVSANTNVDRSLWEIKEGGTTQWSIQYEGGGSGATNYLDIENQIGGTETNLRLDGDGNVEVSNGDLAVSGTTDGVDLDNPGTAITVNSNQYEVADNSLTTTELDTGDVDSRYVNRGGDIMSGNLDMGNNNIIDTNSFYLDSNGVTSFWDGTPSSPSGRLLKIYDSGNVEIPNGNLNIQAGGKVKSKGGLFADIDSDSTTTGSAKFAVSEGNDNTRMLTVNENGKVEIPNGDLILNEVVFNNNAVIQSTRGDDNLYMDLGTGGAGRFLVRDGSNNNLLNVQNSGNIDIPNGNLNMNGNSINNAGSINVQNELVLPTGDVN